jgi:hypothetical protein
MAKPTKYAGIICTVTMIIAIIGIIASLIMKNPIPAILLLLPTVAYEIYRTEGVSTKIASVAVGVILVLEIILIIFNVNFDLASYLGAETQYLAGYEVPLGSLTIVGPAVIAVLAIVLFVQTYGVFTKWLAVTIFVTAFVIIYTISPTTFQDLLQYGVKEAIDRGASSL